MRPFLCQQHVEVDCTQRTTISSRLHDDLVDALLFFFVLLLIELVQASFGLGGPAAPFFTRIHLEVAMRVLQLLPDLVSQATVSLKTLNGRVHIALEFDVALEHDRLDLIVLTGHGARAEERVAVVIDFVVLEVHEWHDGQPLGLALLTVHGRSGSLLRCHLVKANRATIRPRASLVHLRDSARVERLLALSAVHAVSAELGQRLLEDAIVE